MIAEQIYIDQFLARLITLTKSVSPHAPGVARE